MLKEHQLTDKYVADLKARLGEDCGVSGVKRDGNAAIGPGNYLGLFDYILWPSGVKTSVDSFRNNLQYCSLDRFLNEIADDELAAIKAGGQVYDWLTNRAAPAPTAPSPCLVPFQSEHFWGPGAFL